MYEQHLFHRVFMPSHGMTELKVLHVALGCRHQVRTGDMQTTESDGKPSAHVLAAYNTEKQW